MRRQKGNVEQQWVRVERSAWGCVGDRPETDAERKKERDRDIERERWGGRNILQKKERRMILRTWPWKNTDNRQCCNAML